LETDVGSSHIVISDGSLSSHRISKTDLQLLCSYCYILWFCDSTGKPTFPYWA